MTHNERVLSLLSDGRPHSHHELYGLHVIAHSRISDLRKQGHSIEQWREGDLYLYRLLNRGGKAEGTAAPASIEQPESVSPAGCSPSAPVWLAHGPATSLDSGGPVAVGLTADGAGAVQLSFEEAAA